MSGWPEKTSQGEIPDIRALTPEANAERKMKIEQANRDAELARWKSIMFKNEWDKKSRIDAQLATPKLIGDLDSYFITWAPLKAEKWISSLDQALAIQNWPSLAKTSVDPTVTAAMNQLNKEVGDIADNPNKLASNFWKIFSSLPQWMKDFFKWLLGLFIDLWNSNSTENSDKKFKNINEEQKKILDNYGVNIDKVDGKTDKLSFPEWSKVTWKNTPKSTELVDPKNPIKTTEIPIGKDNSINLNNPDIKTIDIKDNSNWLTMTVKRNDGSIDTYTVISQKKLATIPKV